MMIGKIDFEPIVIETDIDEMNPLIAGSLMMPVVKGKKGKNIFTPFNPPPPVRSAMAYNYYYQSFIADTSMLSTELSWGKSTYNIPDLKKSVALKADDIMSIVAMMYYEDEDIHPIIITFSEDDRKAKVEWLKKFTDDYTVVKVDYGKFGEIINTKDFENWIFATIAGMYHNTIWMPFPYTEVNEYTPGYTTRMIIEGSEWLSRFYLRPTKIETPWAGKLTRTEIIKEIYEDKINTNILNRLIRCRCGECFECFMNVVMMLNLGMNPKEVFKEGFNNKTLINKIQIMIEEKKLNPSLEKEIKATMK